MSIPVDLPDLAQTVAGYGFAYLLASGGEQGAPRAVAVQPVLENGVFCIGSVGQRTRSRLATQPLVALVWPPPEAGGYSLLCDGTARVHGEDVHVTPVSAVLHRPAPKPPT